MKIFTAIYYCAMTFALCSVMASCEEDTEPMPAYTQELAELLTDAEGRATKAVCDTGDTLSIINHEAISRLTPDTLYRVKMLYIPQGNRRITLTSLAAVPAPLPRIMAEEDIKRDPLKIDALWQSGRYINITLSLPTSGKPHTFAFADLGQSTQPDGTRLQRLRLSHNKEENEPHYTQQTTVSCPLYVFAETLRTGTDSVEINISTVHGEVCKRLPY